MTQYDEEQTVDQTRRRFLRNSLMTVGGLAALALTRDRMAAASETPVLPDRKPEGPDDEAYWRQARASFQFEPGVTYMNNAGLGLPLPVAIEAVRKGYATYYGRGIYAEEALEETIRNEAHPAVGRLIGAAAHEFALTRNATEGLTACASGIDLAPGDEVLMTTHEYPAGSDAWLLKSQRFGIKVRKVRIPNPPSSKAEVVELFRRGITPNTKVLTFCHITRGAGLLFPAKELCALAKEHGLISIIDGAQTVAHIPVDVKDIGCDLYVSSLHKWALTPAGTGLLYVRPGFQKQFWPLIPGAGPWNYPNAGGWRYEAIGTHELPVRAAIAPTLEFLNTIGLDHIHARDRMLSDYLKAELGKIPEITLATSTSHDLSGPGITSFSVKDWNGYSVSELLQEEYRILVSSDGMDDNNLIRVSTHFYNTKEEVDLCIAALKGIIRFGREKLGATGG